MHVTRKVKENNVKRKKLEASRIKGHQSISWEPFVISVLELVLERRRA